MVGRTEPHALPRAPERFGRYEVFPAFAHGGMASVHVGRILGPSGFSKLVAIKRLNPVFSTSERHARMLIEEARVTARIRSPFVVPVIEVVHEGDALCIVMELVIGVSLASLLAVAAEDDRPMPPGIAVAIMADALRGLHAAHEAKGVDGNPLEIIHRDVSPQNILVGVDGMARVLDFGVARALGREPLSQTGEVHGKVGYMAPEQLRAGSITRRADIYAAGVVLWEALAGERLRKGDALAIAASILEPPPPPSARVPSSPRSLDEIVACALEVDEPRRWATAEAMAVALEEAFPPATRDEVARFVEDISGRDLERLTAAIASAEASAAPGPAPAVVEDGRAPASRSSAGWIVAGVALVTAASLAAASTFVARRGDPAPSPSSAPVAAAASELSTASPPEAVPSASISVPTASPSAPTVVRAAAPRAPRPQGKSAGSRAPASCTPPYDFDDRGIKHYKPGCIQ